VLKDSNNPSSMKKKSSKKKSTGPVAASKKEQSGADKKSTSTGRAKKKAIRDPEKSTEHNIADGGNSVQELVLSVRPRDEVVTYDEIEFHLQEVSSSTTEVIIGPPSLTRFEKARITGARSLQLSLGAPSLIAVTGAIKDSISLAIAELEARALPISIRRVLPNGLYQDIPIDWLR
jgi:DNA-directed RNA polymerase I, II, and III subunit RPABC2